MGAACLLFFLIHDSCANRVPVDWERSDGSINNSSVSGYKLVALAHGATLGPRGERFLQPKDRLGSVEHFSKRVRNEFGRSAIERATTAIPSRRDAVVGQHQGEVPRVTCIGVAAVIVQSKYQVARRR